MANNLVDSLNNISIENEKPTEMDTEIQLLLSDPDDDDIVVSPNNKPQPSNADLMQFLMKMNVNLASNTVFKATATKRLNELESKTDSNAEKITQIEAQLADMKSAASFSLADGWSEQRKLRNNITIIGIHRSQGEILTNIVLDLFIFFGQTITSTDVENVYRVKHAKSNMIIVKLSNFDIKLKLLSAKKNKKITIGDILSVTASADNMGKEIYINTHVTPFVGRLLYRGRTAVKNGKLAACWMSANSILVKTAADADPIAIKSMSDFDKILGTSEMESSLPTSAPAIKRRIEDESPSNKIDRPKTKPRRATGGRNSPGPLSSKNNKKDKTAHKDKK